MVQTIQREFRSRCAETDRGIGKSLGHGFVIPGGEHRGTRWSCGLLVQSRFWFSTATTWWHLSLLLCTPTVSRRVGGCVAERRTTTERLGSFSDGVFTVVITIMVLELKPPEHPTFAALLPLWPTALSYVVSYYFIAIVWLNHHHLFKFFPRVTPRLIWINLVHLFMVSLVPFSTAWVAEAHLAAFEERVYAVILVLVNLELMPCGGDILDYVPVCASA